MSRQLSGMMRATAARAFARRAEAGRMLTEQAEPVARACHAMAARFQRRGKLLVFGTGAPATDAQHVSVEFVHPLIVGRRALPAISLTSDVATLTGVAGREGFGEIFAHQLRYLGAPEDIALGISSDGDCPSTLRGLEAGKELGLLTIALVGGDGGRIGASPAVDHLLLARSDDPLIAKELHATVQHLLWELVHVFLEQPGLLDPETAREV
jgi:D-sedoheptulose 7-phosphate isomerase